MKTYTTNMKAYIFSAIGVMILIFLVLFALPMDQAPINWSQFNVYDYQKVVQISITIEFFLLLFTLLLPLMNVLPRELVFENDNITIKLKNGEMKIVAYADIQNIICLADRKGKTKNIRIIKKDGKKILLEQYHDMEDLKTTLLEKVGPYKSAVNFRPAGSIYTAILIVACFAVIPDPHKNWPFLIYLQPITAAISALYLLKAYPFSRVGGPLARQSWVRYLEIAIALVLLLVAIGIVVSNFFPGVLTLR